VRGIDVLVFCEISMFEKMNRDCTIGLGVIAKRNENAKLKV